MTFTIDDNVTADVRIIDDYFARCAQEAMWRTFVEDRVYTDSQRDKVVDNLLTCQEAEFDLMLPDGCQWNPSDAVITSPVGVDLTGQDLEALLNTARDRVVDQFAEIEIVALQGADELDGIAPHQRVEVEGWLPDDHGLTPDQVTELIGDVVGLAERHADDRAGYDAALAAAYRRISASTSTTASASVIDEKG